ncbi:MAG: glycosyltransferase family 4 protein [Planctomycetota bacterium]
MHTLLHVLSGLEVGGKERIALELARRGRALGHDHRLLLFDTPFRGTDVDFDPGDVPVTFLPRGPGLDGRFALRLARLLRREGVDAVHAHNDTAVFYASLACRLAGRARPVCCGTFHTYPGHDTPAARRLTRWSTRWADDVTAVSVPLGERLVASGWIRGFQPVWNGIDTDAFHPAPRPGDRAWRGELLAADDAVLVGHMGRLDPIKRHVDLVEAARGLADERPELTFALVGQGPELDTVRAAAQGLKQVRFVPRVEDVAAFFRALDVFVLCSSYEAAPRVLLEAMACGCPVVATAVGGIPAMLGADEGEPAGVLVAPERPAELAAALRELAASPERRVELGERARRRALAFSSEHEWRQYAELYRLTRDSGDSSPRA